jgi:hypothetical protein
VPLEFITFKELPRLFIVKICINSALSSSSRRIAVADHFFSVVDLLV